MKGVYFYININLVIAWKKPKLLNIKEKQRKLYSREYARVNEKQHNGTSCLQSFFVLIVQYFSWVVVWLLLLLFLLFFIHPRHDMNELWTIIKKATTTCKAKTHTTPLIKAHKGKWLISYTREQSQRVVF